MMTVVPTVSAAVSSLRRPVAVFLAAGVLVFNLPLLVSCRLDQLLTEGPAPVVNLRPDTIGVAEAKPLPVTGTAGGQVQGSGPLTVESGIRGIGTIQPIWRVNGPPRGRAGVSARRP